ncbi:MAG: hypothetical protein RID07_19525 [Lacipirellulaceae bacterium]
MKHEDSRASNSSPDKRWKVGKQIAGKLLACRLPFQTLLAPAAAIAVEALKSYSPQRSRYPVFQGSPKRS